MTKQIRPFMLGIVGDSAAGKTTLTRGITRILGEEESVVVCLDDYHRYDRGERKEIGISALHPDCNYINIMEQQVNLLRLGQPILKPVYNHETGTLDRPEYIDPKKLVIVEGLLSLHSPALQQCYDVTVYLDPDERLRRSWKVARDTTKRGYTESQVLEALERRTKDSENFIWPQKSAADLIVRFWPPYGYFDNEVDNAHLNVRIFQRHNLPRLILEDIFHHAANGTEEQPIKQELNVWATGQPVDILDIRGDIDSELVPEIENELWEKLEIYDKSLPQELGDFKEGKKERMSDSLALTQLLIASYLIKIRQNQPVETL